MIEVGSVVQLRSGGASMTVVEVSHGTVKCAWHDDKLAPHEILVDVRALTELKPKPKAAK